MSIEIIEYPDAELMMLKLASIISNALKATLRHQDSASLAVPGGSTPGPLFDALGAIDLGWDRVNVLLTDERWVPEDSPRSNTALLRERLLVGPAAKATLIPFFTGAASPEDDLTTLYDRVASALPLSVCLLGMGADMHTASLFPGGSALEDALTGEAPVWPMRAPGADEPRVTLGARVLNDAFQRHLVITGPEKREALERARHLPPTTAPVAAILPDTTVHWAP